MQEQEHKIPSAAILADVRELKPHNLHNTNPQKAKASTPDIKVTGNADLFTVLSKASSTSQGWMKSTKAMEIPGIGCVVQVSTKQVNPDNSSFVAEALCFVPGATIVGDENGGKQLTK